MLTEILRRYQSFNPDTGAFDQPRSLRTYAVTLGVNVSTLSILFADIQAQPSMRTMQALAHTFPQSIDEIAAAIAAVPDRQHERVPA